MWDNKTHKPRWPALVATAILALFLIGLYPVLAAPPGNDDIAAATIIPGVPYSDYIFDTTEATVGDFDPFPSCNYYGQREATVWYAFTPVASMLVVASTSGSSYVTTMGVYIDDQGTLSETHCAIGNGSSVFQVAAGQTYYIMIAAVEGGSYPYPPSGFGGTLSFSLDVAPPPSAQFYYYPDLPSTLDVLQFYNWSYDPACYGCVEMFASWNFGDGTTSEDWSPTHQYEADGDYTVSLTVTTQDGRTATTSQNLQVRTNDVAITKFTVPNAAKVGQTRSVSVEVKNTQYPVTVQVMLFKSTLWGWEWIGALVQELPVRSSNNTTKYAYTYTFTSQDGALGSINFRAEAVIQNGRDVVPANNEAISLPTKVNP